VSTVNQLPGPWSYLYRPAPTLTNDGSLWVAQVAFLTTNANLPDFVGVVAGQPPEQIPLAGGGSMPRIVTLKHPRYSWLYARRIRTEAFGTPSATSTALDDLHSHVRIVVDFESLPFNPEAGEDAPYMKKTVKGTVDYVTIPGRRMTFSNDEEIDQDTGVSVGKDTYVLTFFQCPALRDDVIRPMVNKINDTDFLGFPAGQLHFDTWEGTEDVSMAGTRVFTRTIQITYQDHHWNDFFRKDGVLDTPNDAASNPVYEHAEFNDLLTI
jgi:hypothetical protein